MLDAQEETFTIPSVRQLVDFGIIDQAPRGVLDNVSSQLFPILADRQRLQHFLDRQYNDTVGDAGMRFDVVSPVVFFSTLFYPRMFGYERAEASVLEQDEYYFLVPVRLRRWSDEGEHEEYGVVLPYIYVSNSVSTPLGRELFGWQKNVYRIGRVSPRGARLTRTEPYLEVHRPVPGRAGEGMEYRTVLSVRYRADTAPHRLDQISRRIFEVLDDLPTVFTLGARALLSELGRRDGQLSVPEQVRAIGSMLSGLLYPNDTLNVYSMAQFPHPSIGTVDDRGYPIYAAAFQSLMRTRLRVRNLRDVGPLGSSALGALDPSRGFSLRLADYGVEQVVTRLGLQVWDSDPSADGKREEHVVHPFFPSSARFDLEIAELETLARRSAVSDWTDGDGRLLGRHVPETAARYNTYQGPASAEGFSSYGRTPQQQSYRILGLRASLETLRARCREVAPMPSGLSLEPRVVGGDGVVAIIVTRLPPNREPVDHLEWFSGIYVNIAIVADLSCDGRSRLVFVETHGFTDNPHAFVVGRELLAANRWLMEVDESPHSWLPVGDPREGQHMLSVRTETIRTLDAGDRLRMNPLLDIVDCKVPEHDQDQSNVFASILEQVFAEQELCYLRMDTLPTVDCGGTPRPALLRCNVERVRFAEPPQVAGPPSWLGHHDLYVYPYASVPLVEQLGLWADLPAPAPVAPAGAPQPQRIPCAFALGGRLPAGRRQVLALFEATDHGWLFPKLDSFLHPDDPERRHEREYADRLTPRRGWEREIS